MCTAQKESVFGVILVRIFPAFSRIRTEYGKVREKYGSEYGHFLSGEELHKNNRVSH